MGINLPVSAHEQLVGVQEARWLHREEKAGTDDALKWVRKSQWRRFKSKRHVAIWREMGLIGFGLDLIGGYVFDS